MSGRLPTESPLRRSVTIKGRNFNGVFITLYTPRYLSEKERNNGVVIWISGGELQKWEPLADASICTQIAERTRILTICPCFPNAEWPQPADGIVEVIAEYIHRRVPVMVEGVSSGGHTAIEVLGRLKERNILKNVSLFSFNVMFGRLDSKGRWNDSSLYTTESGIKLERLHHVAGTFAPHTNPPSWSTIEGPLPGTRIIVSVATKDPLRVDAELIAKYWEEHGVHVEVREYIGGHTILRCDMAEPEGRRFREDIVSDVIDTFRPDRYNRWMTAVLVYMIRLHTWIFDRV